MKESHVISNESYRIDNERLWRTIRRLRDYTKYKDVTYTIQNWAFDCDGRLVNYGKDLGLDITATVNQLSYPITNSAIIDAIQAKVGDSSNTDLPVMFTGSIDVEYTLI